MLIITIFNHNNGLQAYYYYYYEYYHNYYYYFVRESFCSCNTNFSHKAAEHCVRSGGGGSGCTQTSYWILQQLISNVSMSLTANLNIVHKSPQKLHTVIFKRSWQFFTKCFLKLIKLLL